MNQKFTPKAALVLFVVFVLVGCTTATPPPDSIKRIPVAAESGEGASVAAAAIQVIGGRLYATGRVKITDSRPGNSRIHIDVLLLDASGRELALKSNSVPTHARTSRVNQISPYWVLLEPWPDGVAQVRVAAHLNQHVTAVRLK